jgi:hypothetical protein
MLACSGDGEEILPDEKDDFLKGICEFIEFDLVFFCNQLYLNT